MYPALQGRILNHCGPPGSPSICFFYVHNVCTTLGILNFRGDFFTWIRTILKTQITQALIRSSWPVQEKVWKWLVWRAGHESAWHCCFHRRGHVIWVTLCSGLSGTVPVYICCPGVLSSVTSAQNKRVLEVLWGPGYSLTHHCIKQVLTPKFPFLHAPKHVW